MMPSHWPLKTFPRPHYHNFVLHPNVSRLKIRFAKIAVFPYSSRVSNKLNATTTI
jgi:hypothetical protein